jgi:hypothetical protein
MADDGGRVPDVSEQRAEAIQREAHLAQVISAIVRAYDHPADGTAYARMREAIDDARRVLHEPFPYYAAPKGDGGA